MPSSRWDCIVRLSHLHGSCKAISMTKGQKPAFCCVLFVVKHSDGACTVLALVVDCV